MIDVTTHWLLGRTGTVEGRKTIGETFDKNQRHWLSSSGTLSLQSLTQFPRHETLTRGQLSA